MIGLREVVQVFRTAPRVQFSHEMRTLQGDVATRAARHAKTLSSWGDSSKRWCVGRGGEWSLTLWRTRARCGDSLLVGSSMRAASALGAPAVSSSAASCVADAATSVCTSLVLRELLHTALRDVRPSSGAKAGAAGGLGHSWGQSRYCGCRLHTADPLRLSRRIKPPPLTAIQVSVE